MPDSVEVRKPDQLVVTGTTAHGQPLAWTFDKTGLRAVSLGGRTVLSGGTAPVSCDHLFDAAEARDKVGKPIPWDMRNGFVAAKSMSSCTIAQVYEHTQASQRWTADGEDATCELTIWNYGSEPIRYPALAGLTAQFPAPATGIGVNDPTWSESYLCSMGRDALTPSYYIRLRRNYLAGGGVAVAILPLDLGDERCLIWWKDLPPDQWAVYTSRAWTMIYDRSIPPGESRTFRLAIRVSDDVTFEHMLGAWKGAKP